MPSSCLPSQARGTAGDHHSTCGNKEMDAPISASQGAMRSLPGKLESLLLGPRNRLRPEEKYKLRILQGDLQGLIANYLLEPSEVESPASTANFWMKGVRDLSFDIDDFLYELTQGDTSGSRISAVEKLPRVKISRFPEKLRRRQWIAGEISGFRTRVKEAIQLHKSYLSDCKLRPSSSNLLGKCQDPAPVSCSQTAIRLVGVDSSIKQLCGWLANDGQPEHKVVSIVGTCGVGKTTLAKEVYRKLGGQFECRAFVQTSRKPDMKRLFTSILSQVRRQKLPDSCGVHKLVLNINKHLQDKTYIIVIDDMWASSTWDIVNHALPKGNCCSRILATTEVDAMAQTCYTGTSKYMPCKKEGNTKYILNKEPLSEDESRELLLSTVFGLQAECPQGLKEVSSEIIKRSGGLPLKINILASLLAHQPVDSIEQWNYIKNSLSSDLSTDSSLEGIEQVVNLGYDNLPHDLKACMLYLCMYEEDCVIWKGDLLKQWVAEGFICPVEADDGKEVAQIYFDELVYRGIIQPVDINCNDEILSCKVHHLVLSFIRHKCIEENFCIAIDHSQTTIRLADKVRRLALLFGNVEDATPPALARMRLSQVRSLSFSGLLKCMPSIVEFRFLQVLILKLSADPDNRIDNLTGPDDLIGNLTEPDDLSDNLTEPDDLSYNLTEISELFRLRYFHLDACHMSVELPTQMQRLKDLVAWEIDAVIPAVASDIVDLTGLLYLSIPSETHLPTGIGRMTSLRTLGVIDLSRSSTENIMSVGELTNLQDLRLTCSILQPDSLELNLECLGSIIRKLSNLKCVSLVPAVSSRVNIQNDDSVSSMSISWHDFNIVPLSPALMQRLELSRRCCIFSSLPQWTNELTKLCILKIAVRKLSSENVAILKGLPSLTVLSLFVWTTPGRRIIFDNEGFSVLEYFKFVCATPCMVFLDRTMPKVRKLKLGFNANRMKRYSLVTAGFEHLTGLNEISTKIGGAGDDECDRRSVELVLTDAISKHPSIPIINVQWVNWNFCGDDEKYIEVQKETWKYTLGKEDVITGESSDEHGIQENNLEEDVKKQADIRTYTALESTSHLQNTEDKWEGPGPGDDDLDDKRDMAVVEAVWVVEQWTSLVAGGRLVVESSENAEEYRAADLVGMAGTRVEVALQMISQLLIGRSASLTLEEVHASLLPPLLPTVSTFSSASSVDSGNEGDESAIWGRWSSVSGSENLDMAGIMHTLPYLISPYTINILKDIADLLLRAGHAPKLCQVYVKARRDTLLACLDVLGIGKMSLEDVHRMEWVVLNNKMKKWIQALKVVVHGLLAEERLICSQIFRADAYVEEECFTEVSKACVLQLLRFADNIAIWKPSSKKLFCILDMYEALTELLPELEASFSVKVSSFIKEEAEQTLVRLGDAVRGTVSDFANEISGETSRISIPGGRIHPMTRYVMNYVVEAANYSRWLNHLLDGCETQVENEDRTPFGHCVLILITHLVSKIEEKSKLYDDEALQNIFLMNNLQYIMQKLRDSELKTLHWTRMRQKDSGHQLRTHAKRYLRSSLTSIMANLRDDGLPQTTGSSSSLKGALKERFKGFNLAYEKLYRTQTTWMVVDPQLREELRISISEQLIPAYRSFVGRYRGQLEGLRNFRKYVKYSPEDLENQILDFFEG